MHTPVVTSIIFFDPALLYSTAYAAEPGGKVYFRFGSNDSNCLRVLHDGSGKLEKEHARLVLEPYNPTHRMTLQSRLSSLTDVWKINDDSMGPVPQPPALDSKPLVLATYHREYHVDPPLFAAYAYRSDGRISLDQMFSYEEKDQQIRLQYVHRSSSENVSDFHAREKCLHGNS
jgi:hypothetical protein